MARFATALALWCLCCGLMVHPSDAQEIQWDLLNQNYGQGDGKISFNGSMHYVSGAGTPPEQLSADYATIHGDVPADGFFYAALAQTPKLPADDLTIEFKVGLTNPDSILNIYLSNSADPAQAKMNHILQVNKIFDQYKPDTIADYNQRAKAANLAPSGFNGNATHTYRLVRQNGKTRVYLDGQTKPIIDALIDGAGAAGDHQQVMFGLGRSTPGEAAARFYFLRIATGAHPPTGPEPILPTTIPAETSQSRPQAALPDWRQELRQTLANVGSEKQLLIDDLFFDQSSGIQFVVHPPQKTHEQNLVRDRPWESATLNWFNVMRDGGKYRMWYECYDIDGWPTGDDTSFCYAESADGIHWTKPNLGLHEYQGSQDTNILFRLIGQNGYRSRVHGVGIFKDPTAPPEQRYKAVSQGVFDGVGSPPQRIAGMVSPDGLNWTRLGDPVCNVFADSQDSAFWDPSRGSYLLYGRVAGNGRAIGVSESKDFANFPPLKLALQTDARQMPQSDLYNPAALQYPFAAHAYFMFPSLFAHQPDTLDIRLAVSRDGVHWSFPQIDTPFIALGATGEFDSGSLYMGQGLLQVGNELWQFYGGSHLKHGEGELENVRKPDGSRTFSRVISRLDGFISADPAAEAGTFTTIPLYYTGNLLKVNATARQGGSIRVGLLDDAGNAISGRSVEECLPITGDQLDTVVRWKDGADVMTGAGKPVRLKVELRNASLYAFQFLVGHAGEDRDH